MTWSARAVDLVAPSPPCGVDAVAVDELSTYEWLRRVGLEKHAQALEDNGYGTARSLYGLCEGVLKDDCGVRDKVALKQLGALMGTNAASARELLRFTSPDCARIRSSFLAAFADATAEREIEAHASVFVRALTDGAGHGLISIHQLEVYLGGCVEQGAAAAASAAHSELVEHVRPAPPPKPEPEVPTDFAYTMLKEHGLETYAGQLIDAGLASKADLMLEPRIALNELENKLGVSKIGDARKIFNLVKELA